jgi:AcrR family transcriptional regulator
MTEALGAPGYADVTTTHVSERANVSTSTFYKHFGNLWNCLLAAYVAPPTGSALRRDAASRP